MIPRYQKVILWLLLVGSVLMAAYLIRLRARAQDQLAAVEDASPMPVPVEAPSVPVTLMIANDEDGSLSPVEKRLPLPTEETTRARALLNDLLREYAKADSPHKLAAVSAVNEVFLLPAPDAKTSPALERSGILEPGAAQMAVINLNGAFVDHHPSGILVETLTLLSILGTLHAAFPQITQVRFLVDGKTKETLAGHADLTRTYLTTTGTPAAATEDSVPVPSSSKTSEQGAR